eukprot:294226-Hanusia_phi.AAC.3
MNLVKEVEALGCGMEVSPSFRLVPPRDPLASLPTFPPPASFHVSPSASPVSRRRGCGEVQGSEGKGEKGAEEQDSESRRAGRREEEVDLANPC